MEADFNPRFRLSLENGPGCLLLPRLSLYGIFFPPLEGTPTSVLPLSSFTGILSMILAGLLFGYIYQRTQNIIAPWLAHAISGITLVIIGWMSFLQYVE